MLFPRKIFLSKLNFYPKIKIFAMGVFKILKNKVSKSILWLSPITKMAKIWHFLKFFHTHTHTHARTHTHTHARARTRTHTQTGCPKKLQVLFGVSFKRFGCILVKLQQFFGDVRVFLACKFSRKTAFKFQKCFRVMLFQEFVTDYYFE